MFCINNLVTFHSGAIFFKFGFFPISFDFVASQFLLEIVRCITLSPQSVSSHLILFHLMSCLLSVCHLVSSHLISSHLVLSVVWVSSMTPAGSLEDTQKQLCVLQPFQSLKTVLCFYGSVEPVPRTSYHAVVFAKENVAAKALNDQIVDLRPPPLQVFGRLLGRTEEGKSQAYCTDIDVPCTDRNKQFWPNEGPLRLNSAWATQRYITGSPRHYTHLRTWKFTHLRTWEIHLLTHLENHLLTHLGLHSIRNLPANYAITHCKQRATTPLGFLSCCT